MKRGFILLFVFAIFVMPVKADYVVMSEGVILEEKGEHHIQSVASISKVMSAIVAIEHGNILDKVKVDKEATNQIGSSIYVIENEEYSLYSLLIGLMLRSGNDAAYLIAKHVGGNVEQFVKMMNQKAKQLNMKDTHFSNPSGLDEFDKGNTSTVFDMALCMDYAMNNEIFKMIINTREYKAENNRVWTNKNRLLKMYENCNGGKTGYTKKSGKTLITSANLNGFETIVVSFRESEYFNLHRRLHESIYVNYKSTLLISKGTYKIKNRKYVIQEDIRIISKVDEPIHYSISWMNHNIMIRYKQLEKWTERQVIAS